MLSLPEKIAFLLALLVTLILALQATRRLIAILGRGHGRPDWRAIPRRLPAVLAKTVSLSPVFRARPLPSLFHALVAWGFIYYLLVNLGDVLHAYLSEFTFLGTGPLGDAYRYGADLLSACVLLGMLALIARRFVLRTPELKTREATLLHPKARSGIQRDSAIVGGFILLHVGARLIGQSLALAQHGADRWQPFASTLAGVWVGLPPRALLIGEHVAWWLALGLILAFVPYFPYSKHLHLFFAPLNFLLKPERPSIGQLDRLDFDDQSVESVRRGAAGGPGVDGADGRLRVHHVQPLPGCLPGVPDGQGPLAGGARDQQALLPEPGGHAPGRRRGRPARR